MQSQTSGHSQQLAVADVYKNAHMKNERALSHAAAHCAPTPLSLTHSHTHSQCWCSLSKPSSICLACTGFICTAAYVSVWTSELSWGELSLSSAPLMTHSNIKSVYKQNKLSGFVCFDIQSPKVAAEIITSLTSCIFCWPVRKPVGLFTVKTVLTNELGAPWENSYSTNAPKVCGGFNLNASHFSFVKNWFLQTNWQPNCCKNKCSGTKKYITKVCLLHWQNF